ncbi:MAG: hypothetical protein K0R78_3028 [Pelosinus sp.]|jgi:hypothetical protein|nr:hypothetical protein [Pelosinus sp.]
MSINPIELQVLIPKSTEVGKAQQVVNRQDTLQQQHAAEQWKDISTNRQQQVQSTAKNEGGKVGREKHAKEQNHSPKEQHHKNKEQNNTDSDKVNRASKDDPVRGHLIDIKT